MRKFASLLIVLMLITALAFAQTRTITGRVTDAQGKAVPFATVTIKGTTTGVSADENGNFSIQAAPSSTLVFSAAGFQGSEVAIGSQSTVNATLSAQNALNEVVVTALGIRRTRNQVPYAAQQVTGDEVNKQRTSNFMENLSGKVSGLELRQSNTLGGSTNIVLRGVKSMTGNNQALFVIDGVPIDNSNFKSVDPVTGAAQQSTGRGGFDYGSNAADVNPDDIESITVLKGAASTALYGSRGGNGVILITTKKGARGLGITVNSGITVGKYDKSTFAKYQNQYGGGYGAYYEDPTGRFLYRDINGDGVKDLVTPLSEDASYGGAFDPNLMVYQWDAFDPASPNYGKPRPWLPAVNGPAYIFQNQVSSNQSIFIDGGGDKGSFKLGYTRTDDRGIMPNSLISKNLINFGSTYNISSNLTATASVSYTNQSAFGRYGTGYDDKNLMTNFRQWFQTNVDLQEQKDAYFRNYKNITWNWADPTDLTPIYWDNPYFSRYENYSTDSRDRVFGYASLNFKPIDGLNILGRAGLDTYGTLLEERQAKGSVAVSNYNRTNINFTEANYDLIATYDKNLSADINLKALLGTNVRINRFQSLAGSTNGGLIVEKIYALSNSANPITAPLETDAKTQVWGNFAGLTFSWRDLVTLDGTVRVDQSSTLPKENNTYWYPAGSIGFIFSKLLPSAGWLSYGKLRANIAGVGNGTSAYATDPYYTIGSPFGAAAITFLQTSLYNNNLKPERTTSYEFGIEASFLKNRLGFDVSYYNAKTYNQIYPVPVSTSTGYSSYKLNAGDIRNQGVELSINGAPVQNNNFSWNIALNWSRNRNKVERLYESSTGAKIDNIVLGTFQGGITLNASLGEPYGTIRGTDFIYTNGQKTVGSNGRYLKTPSSNVTIGNSNPDWIGGINNQFKYKNFALSFLVDFRQGGDVFSLDMYYGLATGLYPETAGLNDLGNPSRSPLASGGGIIRPGVTEDGKTNTKRVSNSNYGTYGYSVNPDAKFVYDASFVKLRETVLTYTLPRSVIGHLHPFKSIDISLVGRNLWIIHKNLPYADPEEIIGAGNLQGYQVGAYPSVKALTFNLKLRF